MNMHCMIMKVRPTLNPVPMTLVIQWTDLHVFHATFPPCRHSSIGEKRHGKLTKQGYSNKNTRADNHGQHQPLFQITQTEFPGSWLRDEIGKRAVKLSHQNQSHDYSQERQVSLSQIEAIIHRIYMRHEFKEGIVYHIRQRHVYCRVQDCGVKNVSKVRLALHMSRPPAVMCRWSIAGCDCRLGLPVSLRRHLARRRRMFTEEVSEDRKNITINMGPESQSIIQAYQCQSSAGILKPLSTGSSAGPIVADPA